MPSSVQAPEHPSPAPLAGPMASAAPAASADPAAPAALADPSAAPAALADPPAAPAALADPDTLTNPIPPAPLKTRRGLSRQTAFRLAAGLLFALLLGLGLLQAACRYDLRGDELFSYALANNEKPFKFLGDPWSQDTYHNGWLYGSDMRAYLQADTGTGFHYAMVYKHQREDVHPPLYYILLHTVSSLFTGSFSPWLALSVNLAAYAGCLWLLWALAQRLVPKARGGEWAALALPLIWAVLPCTAQNLVFMRMYMLLSFWVLLFAYLVCGILVRGSLGPKTALALGLTVFLGSQTHYYFYVYGGLLALLAGLWMLFERWPLKALALYAGSGCAGVLLSVAAYPHIFRHAADMMRTNGGDTRGLLTGLLRAIELVLGQDLGEKRALVLAALALVLGAAVLVQRRGALPRLTRADGALLLLGVSALLAAPVIMKLSAIQSSRYLAPIHPLLTLCAGALAARLLAAVRLPGEGGVFLFGRSFWLAVPRGCRQAAAFVLAGLLALALWTPAWLGVWRQNRAEQLAARQCAGALGELAEADCVWAAPEVDYLLGNEFCALAGFDEVCPVSFDELGRQGLQNLLAGRASVGGPVWVCIPAVGEDPAGQLAAALGGEFAALEFAASNGNGAYYRYIPQQ